jgi:hypothetical protein
MFRIESVKDCDVITLEPGDRTKYKFIVINLNDDYIIISGIETKFNGYEFRKDDIRHFFDVNGKPPQEDKYHKWADALLHKKEDYLLYVQDHTGGIMCNPFTALAALYAGFIFLESEFMP